MSKSVLADYMLKEQKLKELQEELERLQNDERLQSALAFKERLDALMNEYGKSVKDVITLLDPDAAQRQAASAPRTRRKRKLKVYRNPHTGEVVETRGGNHKVLKSWKESHGDDVVESWLEREVD